MAQKVKDTSLHPLAEVFGYKANDRSTSAKKHRKQKLCPYNNKFDVCTKDKKAKPLGVCSIHFNDTPTIICPIRFRENWRICSDSASFFFPKAKNWTALKEIRLKEKNGESAGNIDLIIAAHDENGKIYDFGAVEVQAVYVSGNIRKPFEYYMRDPDNRGNFDWTEKEHYPRPDFLSSSRKRLIPQLMYKGQILRAWGKKMVVAVDVPFFNTLPDLPTTSEQKADICWLIYQLKENKKSGKLQLDLDKKAYGGFDDTMKQLGTPEIGSEDEFVASLEKKLNKELQAIRSLGHSSFSSLLEGSIQSIKIETKPNVREDEICP